MNLRVRVLAIFTGFGVALWVLDAVVDYWVFYESSFGDLLLFDVPTNEIYMRLLLVFCCILFGLFMGNAALALERNRKRLQEEKSLLDVTLRSIGDGVIATDFRGRVTFLNAAAEELTGWESKEAAGRPLDEVFNIRDEKTGAAVECPVDRVLREGVVVGLANHTELIAKDGRKIPIRDSGAPIRDNGGILGAVLVFRDAGQEKKHELGLRRERQRLYSLLEELPAYVYLQAPDHTIRYANRRFREIFGEVGQSPCYTLICSRDEPCDPCPTFRVFETGEPQEWEWSDPGGRIYRVYDYFFRDVDSTELVLELGIDVTEHKAAERELTESRRALTTLLANLPGMVYRCRVDHDWTMKFVSQGCRMVTGYDPEDMLDNRVVSYGDLIHPEDREYVWQEIQKALASGAGFQIQYRIRTRSGAERWAFEQGMGVFSDNGDEKILEGFVTDITDLKEAERRLQFQAQLLDSARESVIATDLDGRVIYWGKGAERLYGFSAEETLGREITFIVPRGEERNEEERIRRALEEGSWQGEYEQRRKDGTRFRAETTISTVRDERGRPRGLVGIDRDVTEKKRAEEALRESEQRFRLLFEQAPIGYQSLDEDGRLLAVNRAWTDLTGYEREEVVGRDLADFLSEESREAFEEHFVRFKERGETHGLEMDLVCRDGSIVTLSFEGRVARDAGGGFKQTHCIVYNVTAQKEAENERKRLEAQLRQAQKMEAIGTLAGGIAHDFNNILSAVIGYTELVMDELTEYDPNREPLNNVLQAGLRARELVHQILAFSRRGEQVFQPVDVTPLVKETVRLLRASLPATIDIRQEIHSRLSLVPADPTQIQQVLMNLCTNAAHAMRERGGILEIGLRETELDEGDVRLLPDLSAGKYVRLTVSDTGHGMDPEVRLRIFDPFFTTKKRGEGTGMGLSVVHGIVRSHRGAITVYSEPGNGSLFHVYLPAMTKADEAVLDVPEQPVEGGTERILFVDDEAVLVGMGRQMLERLGYRVLGETDPVQALQRFKSDPHAVDLVITDQTMPGLTGADLTRQMLVMRPELPVILCTGFSETTSEETARQIGVRRFLLKPLLLRDLARAIREALTITP